MKLAEICIKNYRTIINSTEIRIEPFEIIVGKGFAAEADILDAISAFFLKNSEFIALSDFADKSQPIVISATFDQLNQRELMELKRYLFNDKLYLEKILTLNQDNQTIAQEYFGYLPEPRDWWLSLEKIYQRYPDKQIPWEKLAYQNGIVESVRAYNIVTEKSYISGLNNLVASSDIEFDLPETGRLKSLGQAIEVIEKIPDFIFIPSFLQNNDDFNINRAEKVFKDAVDYFLDRIIKSQQVFFLKQHKPAKVMGFVDKTENFDENQVKQEDEFYLNILDESSLLLQQKMSQILSVDLAVKIEPKTASRAEQLKISIAGNEFLNFMQYGYDFRKALIFSLLEIMVLVQAGKYLENRKNKLPQAKAFILTINKPELFLCALAGKKFFSILNSIAEFEQTIMLTTCPNFVDISRYRSVLILQKQDKLGDFNFSQAGDDVLTNFEQTSLSLSKDLIGMDSMLFFSDKILLTENKEQLIAVKQALKKMRIIRHCPEEIGYSFFSANNKSQMIFFIKLLNAFDLGYTILIESCYDCQSRDIEIINNLLGVNKAVCLSPGFQEILGSTADISQFDDYNNFLMSKQHPSDAFRNIINDIFDISNVRKEKSND